MSAIGNSAAADESRLPEPRSAFSLPLEYAIRVRIPRRPAFHLGWRVPEFGQFPIRLGSNVVLVFFGLGNGSGADFIGIGGAPYIGWPPQGAE
jgi:hypothetical protein